jgi:hypothetical protein
VAAVAAVAGGGGVGVEAHRARELKWISLMSTTPPTQARKSKKIRKLLQEGVPASVRYQVWAHLTDSKARRIEGFYSQLGEREKVPAFAEIQRDAQVCFEGDSRLSLPNGPLVSLLQAYLTMVPDIQYSKGGVFIIIDVGGRFDIVCSSVRRRLSIHRWPIAPPVSRRGRVLDFHLSHGLAPATILLFQCRSTRHRRVVVRQGNGNG